MPTEIDYVRVMLGEGDEGQLTDLEPGDYVEWVGIDPAGHQVYIRLYQIVSD